MPLRDSALQDVGKHRCIEPLSRATLAVAGKMLSSELLHRRIASTLERRQIFGQDPGQLSSPIDSRMLSLVKGGWRVLRRFPGVRTADRVLVTKALAALS